MSRSLRGMCGLAGRQLKRPNASVTVNGLGITYLWSSQAVEVESAFEMAASRVRPCETSALNCWRPRMEMDALLWKSQSIRATFLLNRKQLASDTAIASVVLPVPPFRFMKDMTHGVSASFVIVPLPPA